MSEVPQPDFAERRAHGRPGGRTHSLRAVTVHGSLFLLTCVSTYVAGGAYFAATLMSILLVHEMGHYIAARVHHIEASLPFFIPLPPQFSIGTLGAVIRMRRAIANPNKLMDVGAAGPLAGLVVAIPLLYVGLSKSQIVGVPKPGALLEGNSLAYIAVKYCVTGMYLPAADGTDVQLHPMAFAAWVGLLITMINLIPIGQLDGGHVARAYLGNRHEVWSGRLHWVLLAVGSAVTFALGWQARSVGYELLGAFEYGISSGLPWIVWAVLLAVMRHLSGGVYHPDVDEMPLSRGRYVLAFVVAVGFLLIFTPIPMRSALIGSTSVLAP